MLFYFAEGDALDSLVDALRLMQAAQRALANGSHFTLLLATERTQPPQLDEHLGKWIDELQESRLEDVGSSKKTWRSAASKGNYTSFNDI